ncbi:MAG: peptidylprolyl isomerase [Gammaproteobacteria bacterium]|nr:peptidylprolyl isomerase [Gammaproteobacteria bacterium]MCK5669145.1 peptidylprolyl isomerase [Gammaproteobacteria bacterium]
MRLLLAGFLALQTFVLLADVPLDRIVAVVENDIIMQSELDIQLRTVVGRMKEQGVKLPSSSVLENQVLERMILTKIQLQRAESTGIRVDDETLNRTISNIAAGNNVSLSQFKEILENDGFNYEQFRENIRNEIVVSRLRQRQVDNRISITSKEIDNALMNEEFQGSTETEYLLQHILISLPEAPAPEEEEQARLVASKVLEDLKTGQNFATMATTVSDGQRALEGGDLGWRKKNEIPTLFSAQIATMDKGDISDLIKSSSGFHIVKLADVRSSNKHMITQTKARHILIKINELTTTEDARLRLDQLRTRLVGGDDFAKLAKAHSDDTVSAAQGGELGWVSPGTMVTEFENIMNQLEPNEISEPFTTQFGWHLLQVMERREHDDTENARRTKASEAIRRRKSEEAHQNWLRHLRDEAYVEYRLDEG